MIDKAEGLVLRTVVYGESNKIVTLLTREYGKLAVMARGAKKPGSRFNAASQPFVRAVYIYPRSRGLGQLKSADVITSHAHIRQDVVLMAYAMYLLELADKALDERVPQPALYDLFVEGLEAMDEGLDPDVVSFIIELRLLRHLGIAPHLNGCTICGSAEAPFAFRYIMAVYSVAGIAMRMNMLSICQRQLRRCSMCFPYMISHELVP